MLLSEQGLLREAGLGGQMLGSSSGCFRFLQVAGSQVLDWEAGWGRGGAKERGEEGTWPWNPPEACGQDGQVSTLDSSRPDEDGGLEALGDDSGGCELQAQAGGGGWGLQLLAWWDGGRGGEVRGHSRWRSAALGAEEQEDPDRTGAELQEGW